VTAIATETTFRPGVHDGMPEDEYHADPVPGGSLSASGAKLLLPPSCPAMYAWRREHPKVSAEFDFGTAAHKYVLGLGPLVEEVEADDWRTKAAQDKRKAAREAGRVPMLTAQLGEVQAMARAIWAHPVAGPLFSQGRGGVAEQSLFWEDAEFGIWRRARLDWQLPGPRLIVVDYKSTPDASPAAIRKHVANFSYHMQAAQYIDGIRALGLDEDPAFLFVFQEKTAPYLITIAELDEPAIQAGRKRNAEACEIFRDCTKTGIWPGYSDEIELISLPPWVAQAATGGDLS
jgi:hypothetical protein